MPTLTQNRFVRSASLSSFAWIAADERPKSRISSATPRTLVAIATRPNASGESSRASTTSEPICRAKRPLWATSVNAVPRAAARPRSTTREGGQAVLDGARRSSGLAQRLADEQGREREQQDRVEDAAVVEEQRHLEQRRAREGEQDGEADVPPVRSSVARRITATRRSPTRTASTTPPVTSSCTISL